MIKRAKGSAFCGVLLGCVMATLAGCDRGPDTAAAPTGAPGAPASTGGRFVAIAPNSVALAKMHLNYATFKPAPDGSYFEFVPLPPKSGDVIIGINAPGSYTVRLIDSKCAFDVRVAPSEGAPFALNTAAPSHPFVLSKAGQLKSMMVDSAANNYSCNVTLAPI